VELNASFDLIEDDIAAIQEATFLRGYDSVLYEYKDAGTVTILADGQFVNDDNDAIYLVEEDTDVSFGSNLSADVGGGEASSTLYYIWGGEDDNGDLEFWITDSPDTMPSELTKGKRLRGAIYNDGSSNILPFYLASDWYVYDTDINVAGSDTTEVFDATLGTSFIDIDCSAFVPQGIRAVLLVLDPQAGVSFRPNGSANATGACLAWQDSGEKHPQICFVDDDGIVEAKQSSSTGVCISVLGFHL
jgi:hypothetical protein